MKLVECWGDDVPDGNVTSFPMAVKRKGDETVVFSWITWPSRKVRDEGMKKVMWRQPRVCKARRRGSASADARRFRWHSSYSDGA